MTGFLSFISSSQALNTAARRDLNRNLPMGIRDRRIHECTHQWPGFDCAQSSGIEDEHSRLCSVSHRGNGVCVGDGALCSVEGTVR